MPYHNCKEQVSASQRRAYADASHLTSDARGSATTRFALRQPTAILTTGSHGSFGCADIGGDIGRALDPKMTLGGLPDATVQESRELVRAALPRGQRFCYSPSYFLGRGCSQNCLLAPLPTDCPTDSGRQDWYLLPDTGLWSLWSGFESLLGSQIAILNLGRAILAPASGTETASRTRDSFGPPRRSEQSCCRPCRGSNDLTTARRPRWPQNGDGLQCARTIFPSNS